MGIPDYIAASAPRSYRKQKVFCTCLLQDGETEVIFPIRAGSAEEARALAHEGYKILCVLSMETEDERRQRLTNKQPGYRTNTRLY